MAGAQQANAPAFWGHATTHAGERLAGAVIHLQGGKEAIATTADAQGEFRFAVLPSGRYRLSMEWNGRQIRASAPLDLPQTQAASLVLSESNTLVVAFPVTPSPGTLTGGEDLSGQAVSAIPLNKRDFSQLLLLAAGTMTDANGATNFTQQFAINGQRGVEAVFAMDGADTSDPEMGGSTFSNFNVDAVAEIQSSSGWMPAEIGRGASGFTNILTRSGTNASMVRSLSSFVTPPWMLATSSIADLLRIRAGSRRSVAMSLVSRSAALSKSRISIAAAIAPSITFSCKAFARS